MELLVARIGRPHALNGEVTVQTHTDDPQARFTVGAEFATRAEAGSGVPRELVISSARLHSGVWLLGFDGIPDRTGAEGLRGTRLFFDPEAMGDAAGDEVHRGDEEEDEGWYEDELVGLSAVRPTGEVVGTVSGLRTGAAQDLLVLTLTGGAQALIPFVEAIVPEVDVAGGRVVVNPPEGLLDLSTEG